MRQQGSLKAKQVELTTDTGLYNVRGVVTNHMSRHMVLVQTPHGLVISHSGTVYAICAR